MMSLDNVGDRNNKHLRTCKSDFLLSQFAEEYERAEKLVAQKSNEAR